MLLLLYTDHPNPVPVKTEQEKTGGALWDIFRREDSEKLQDYLRKHASEFRHIHYNPVKQVRWINHKELVEAPGQGGAAPATNQEVRFPPAPRLPPRLAPPGFQCGQWCHDELIRWSLVAPSEEPLLLQQTSTRIRRIHDAELLHCGLE